MNSKYSLLIVGLIGFSCPVSFSAQQMTPRQEADRINVLWNLYEHNILTIAQFRDYPDIKTAIDNDILMLEKCRAHILGFKNSIASAIFAKLVSGGLKTIAITSGLISGIGFLSSAFGAYAGHKAINYPDDIAGKAYFATVKELYGSKSSESIEKRIQYLTQSSPDKEYNRAILGLSGAIPFILVVSTLCAFISRYTFKKHADWNSVDIQKEWQEQLNRYELIIARLKQIKYENGL